MANVAVFQVYMYILYFDIGNLGIDDTESQTSNANISKDHLEALYRNIIENI